MTFPVVAATNTSNQAAGTSHTVNLPASIAAGDLLIIFFGYDNTSDDVTTPSGWTLLISVVNNVRLYGYYRVADGGEGATVTVTSGSSGASHHNTYRITGYLGAPEAATNTGNSATPDPPNLTPSWGAADTLWIAAAHGPNSSADATAPTNYGNLLQAQAGVFEMASARRELNAASENPGTFGAFTIAQWEAATVAIRPAAAGHPARKRMAGVPFAAQQRGVW